MEKVRIIKSTTHSKLEGQLNSVLEQLTSLNVEIKDIQLNTMSSSGTFNSYLYALIRYEVKDV